MKYLLVFLLVFCPSIYRVAAQVPLLRVTSGTTCPGGQAICDVRLTGNNIGSVEFTIRDAVGWNFVSAAVSSAQYVVNITPSNNLVFSWFSGPGSFNDSLLCRFTIQSIFSDSIRLFSVEVTDENIDPLQVNVQNAFLNSGFTGLVVSPPRVSYGQVGDSLRVSASAAGSIAYQWQFQQSGIWQSVSDSALYADFTTSSLLIRSLQTSMQGMVFRLRMQSGACVVFSDSTQLSIGGCFPNSSSIRDTICSDSSFLFAGLPRNSTGVYYDTLMNVGGCDSVVSLHLVVVAPLSAGQLSGSSSLCMGAFTTLSSTISGGFWTSQTPQVAAVHPSSGVITPISPGVAILRYRIPGAGVCAYSVSEFVLEVVGASNPASISGPSVLCEGGFGTFNASLPGGIWTSSDPQIASIGSTTGNVNGITQGNVLITYTPFSVGGCLPSSTTVSLQVQSSRMPAIVSGSSQMCLGTQQVLIADVSSGVWSSTNPSVLTVQASTGLVTTIGVGGASIRYTVSDSVCPPAVSSFPIQVVSSLSSGSISGPSSLCISRTANFSSTVSGGVWSSSDTSKAQINPQTGSVVPISIGNVVISYSILASGGCAGATSSVQLSVLPRPVASVSVGGPLSFCSGDSVTLTAAVVGGAYYRWFLGNDTIPGATSRVFRARQSGLYKVRVFLPNGCSDTSNTFQVEVAGPILASVLPSSTAGVCVGDTITLTAQSTGSGAVYRWLRNNAAIVGANQSTLRVTEAGIYRVVVSLGICSDSSIGVQAVFSNPPSVRILPAQDTVFICSGSFFTFNALADSGVDLQWKLNGQNLVGQTEATLQASLSGLYSLAATRNGCSRSSAEVYVVVLNRTAAGISASGPTGFCRGGSVTLTASPAMGVTYNWIRNGVPVQGTFSNFIATQSGSYRVVVTSSNGCSDTSSAVHVIEYLPHVPDTQRVYRCTGQPFLFCGFSYSIPGVYSCILTNSLGCDSLVVAQLIVADTLRVSVQRSICAPDTFQFGPDLLTNSGTYIRRFVARGGCDSLVSLQLFVGQPTSSSISVSICSPSTYLFNGEARSTSGVYRDTLTNTAGCDSFVVLNLNVQTPVSSNISRTICVGSTFCAGLRCYASPGVYRDTLVGSNGCDSIVNLTLTVQSRPTASFTYTGPTTFCSDTSLRLSASPPTGVSVIWLRDGSTFGQQGNIINVNFSGLYRAVFLNNATSCSDTSIQSVQVTVNPGPSVSLTPSDTLSVCSGSSVMLTSSSNISGGVYSWFRDGVLITGANGSSYSASLPGTYRVVVQGGVGQCSGSSNSVVVTQQLVPSVNIQATGPTTFCTGGYVDLQATVTTGLHYRWLRDNDTIPGLLGAGMSYRASVSGNYALRITHIASGCVATTAPVVVNALPNPIATLNFTGFINRCDGQDVVLRVSNAGGLFIQWERNGQLLPGENTDSLTVSISGYYTIRISNALGCAGIASVQVVFNPLPTAFIQLPTGAGTTICAGDSLLLAAAPVVGGTFQWFLNNSAISGAVTNNFVARSTGAYTYRVVTAQGCSVISAPVSVNALPAPVPTISSIGDTIQCSGGSVLLRAGASTGVIYQWYKNDTILLGQTADSIRVAASGLYKVRVQNSANGCAAFTRAISVLVHPLPSVRVDTIGSHMICAGDSVLLVVQANFGVSFQWERDGVPVAGQVGTSFYALDSGLYRVRVTSIVTGCFQYSDPIRVMANPLPSTQISIRGRTSFCRGDSVVLKVQSTPGAIYQWFLNGAGLAGQNRDSLVVYLNSGDYSVRVVSQAGCELTSSGVQVIVRPLPSAPTLTVSQTRDTLYSSALNGNRWFRNGILLQSDTLRYLVLTQNGSYCARVVNADSCISDCSSSLQITNVGLEKPMPYGFRLYPNPNSGKFRVDLQGFSRGKLQISLYNALGQMVYRDALMVEDLDAGFSVDLGATDVGLYWLQVQQEHRVLQERVMIVR